MIGFGIYNSNQADKYKEARSIEQKKTDSLARVEYEQKLATGNLADSTVITVDSTTRYSSSYTPMLGVAERTPQEFYTLENNLLKLTINSKGGEVYSAELKKYKAYGGGPLILFHGEDNGISLEFYTKELLQTNRFTFQPQSSEKHLIVSEQDSLKQLALRLYVDSTSYIEYAYGIRPNSYMVDFSINLVGMDKHISKSATSLDLYWMQSATRLEKGYKNELANTLIAYRYPNNSSIEEVKFGTDRDQKDIKAKVEWIALKQQFFSTILVNKDAFLESKLEYNAYNESNPDGMLANMYASMKIPYNPNASSQTYPLSIYFGPNHYNTLRSFDSSFEELVPLGWFIFGIVNRFLVIPVFNFLSNYIASFGIIILILTILIKIILFPLTQKSYMSSAKMKLLKPEMDRLAAKYPKKEDALKKQQEVSALYKKNGVSMMGGCLPMLLQLPILIAMFRFFPASIELRQQSFLWADDLSSYDAIVSWNANIPFISSMLGNHISLFTVLMAITMFITTRTSMEQQASNQQMPGMKFMMLYFMPIFLLFIFNSLSSGLSYYYFLSNLITIIQTFVIRKWIVKDEDLLVKMKAKAQEPVKKSKFQQRLEDMAKKQQEMQRQQQQQKKKK